MVVTSASLFFLFTDSSTGYGQTAEPMDHRHGDIRFLNSTECAVCHSFSRSARAMRDQQGRNVAPSDLWSASMMANSARDPYWRAVLSAEVAATPSQKTHIEEVCSRCHAPMAAPTTTSPEGQVLAFLDDRHPKAKLATDGVSCTVCHQISPENLGTEASYTGGFVFNTDKLIYGPHANPVTMPMQHHVDYTPVQSDHMLRSSLCATCHTVITHSFDESGQETQMRLHEQVPYFEWRNSVFNDEVAGNEATGRSCQSCHMPQVDLDGQAIVTNLAHNPGGRDFPFLQPRQPFGRHTFAGGNVFMTQLIRENRERLGVVAADEAFEHQVRESRTMLGTQTASITLGPISSLNSMTSLNVQIENLAGHKFPTAYPSRRSWIELVIKDAKGSVVFASGQVNSAGQLIDQNGQVLLSEKARGPIQPHYVEINDSLQVQTYETFMGDTESQVTFALLRGSVFIKDNRLLPKGWISNHPHAEATKPIGTIADEDFKAGGDQVSYRLSLPSGKYEATAKILFQSLSARYVAELFETDTPEVQKFKHMYERADLAPEVVGVAVASFIVD